VDPAGEGSPSRPDGRETTARYFVNRNAQPSGDHEVHRQNCRYRPAARNRIDLGEHASCHGALRAARRHFERSDGCAHCSPACHTG